MKWYRKAAKQGYNDAQYRLGRAYEHGSGVPRDVREAVKWYRKAAEQGNFGAQAALAECYIKGEGVTQDYIRAHAWLNQDLATSTLYRISRIHYLESTLSSDQLAQAKTLAAELRGRIEAARARSSQ